MWYISDSVHNSRLGFMGVPTSLSMGTKHLKLNIKPSKLLLFQRNPHKILHENITNYFRIMTNR